MLQHWWVLAVVEAKVSVTRRFTVTHLRQMMLDELSIVTISRITE